MQRILIVVHDGVAQVVEGTAPEGVSVEILDFEEIEAGPSQREEYFKNLSEEARNYVLKVEDETDSYMREYYNSTNSIPR